MCKLSSKSGGVPFQPLGDLTWIDPLAKVWGLALETNPNMSRIIKSQIV